MPVDDPYIPDGKYLAVGPAADSLTDISDYLTDLEIAQEFDEITFETFDGTGSQQQAKGTQRYMINATLVFSRADGGLHDVIKPLVGTNAFFEGRQDEAAVSDTNEKISGQCFINRWPRIPAGSPNTLHTVTVAWRSHGAVTPANA